MVIGSSGVGFIRTLFEVVFYSLGPIDKTKPGCYFAGMKGKEIVIGLVVVVILILVISLSRNKKKTPTLSVPTNIPSIEQKIENNFNLTIPEDVAKIDLNSVSGIRGMGIATRKYQAGKFSHMVLADLSDPAAGGFYQGWLVKDDNYLATGKLQIAKGGYLLEFIYPTDLSDYKKVLVSLEKKITAKPTEIVLEGSF